MSRNLDRSRALQKKAEQVIPGGVNSPVRAFRAVGGDPPFLVRGEGAHVWDADGNQYIDYVGSWGPLILGHAAPEVVEAIIARGAQRHQLRRARRPPKPSWPSWSSGLSRPSRKCASSAPAPRRRCRRFAWRAAPPGARSSSSSRAATTATATPAGQGRLGRGDARHARLGRRARGVREQTLARRTTISRAVEPLSTSSKARSRASSSSPWSATWACVPPAPGFLEALREITAQRTARCSSSTRS